MEENVNQNQALVSPFDGLSPQDWEAVQNKLWQLLSRTSRLYTMDDSSSVRVETARELLASLLFTLGAYLAKTRQSPTLLVSADLNRLLEEGHGILKEELEEGKRLWQAACGSAPHIDNLSYRDTLRNIGGSFSRYDFRFFAHQIPCEIDYQLSRPVPDTIQGIAYLNEYLRRILAENRILLCFEPEPVTRLLTAYCRDYRGLLINLCEPVFTNAVGLILTGGDPFSLQITDTGRSRLMERFARLSAEASKEVLAKAAGSFCRAAGIGDNFSQTYAAEMARALFPRITAAHKGGNLSGIFLSFA